jgi:hypothetical protein
MNAGTKRAAAIIDEKKRMVSANMSAVEAVASAMGEEFKSSVGIFEGKVKLYMASLEAIDARLKQNDVLIENHHAAILAEVSRLKQVGVDIDITDLENALILAENLELISNAKAALNEAQLEKTKVLETHATLSNFLATIKLQHSQLSENRATVQAVLAEVDIYKKQAAASELEHDNVRTQISTENAKLDSAFRASMSQAEIARSVFNSVEAALSVESSGAQLDTEQYRSAGLIGAQEAENSARMSVLSGIRTARISIARAEAQFDASLGSYKDDVKAALEETSSSYDVASVKETACSHYQTAAAQASSMIETTLTHEISSGGN